MSTSSFSSSGSPLSTGASQPAAAHAPQQVPQHEGSLADLLGRLSTMEASLKGEFQAARLQLSELQSSGHTASTGKPRGRSMAVHAHTHEPLPVTGAENRLKSQEQEQGGHAWLHTRKSSQSERSSRGPATAPAAAAAAAAGDMPEADEQRESHTEGRGDVQQHFAAVQGSASLSDWGVSPHLDSNDQPPTAQQPQERPPPTTTPSTTALRQTTTVRAAARSRQAAPTAAAPTHASRNVVYDALGPPAPQPPTLSAMGARTMHQLLSLATQNARAIAGTSSHQTQALSTRRLHDVPTAQPTPVSPPRHATAGACGVGVTGYTEPAATAVDQLLAAASTQWQGLQPHQFLMPISAAKGSLLPGLEVPTASSRPHSGISSVQGGAPQPTIRLTRGGAAVPHFQTAVPQVMVPGSGLGQGPRPLVPAGHDIATLRQQLGQLTGELESFRAIAADVQAEKELLAAERTLVILHLQTATAALGSGAAAMTAYDQTAQMQAEQHVAALRASLPANSAVRVLTETSELLPHIKGLRDQLLSLHELWNGEVARLESNSEAAHSEMREMRVECELARKEVATQQATAERLTEQVAQLQARLASVHQESELRMKRMTTEVYELQQQVVAAEARADGMEDTAQRARDELTAGRAAVEAERVKWETRIAQLQREQEAMVSQLKVQHHERQEELMKEVQLLRLQADAAAARADEAEQVQLDSEKHDQELKLHAARANDQLATEVAMLREEKLRLQVIVSEADKQLEMLRRDLDNVRRNQVNLMDKLKDQSLASARVVVQDLASDHGPARHAPPRTADRRLSPLRAPVQLQSSQRVHRSGGNRR